MITVRLEYDGMRFERTARDIDHAREQLLDMYRRHIIDPLPAAPFTRGRVCMTGTLARAQFIEGTSK